MQLCFVVGQLLQLQHHRFFILFCLYQVGLGFGLALRFVDNIFGLGFNGTIGVLDKILVCLENVFYSCQVGLGVVGVLT